MASTFRSPTYVYLSFARNGKEILRIANVSFVTFFSFSVMFSVLNQITGELDHAEIRKDDEQWHYDVVSILPM